MNKNYLPRSWRRANDSRVRKVKQNADVAESQLSCYRCTDCGTILTEVEAEAYFQNEHDTCDCESFNTIESF